MNQKFEKNYRLLNPEQKKAVDMIEGPVLMLAGPGSGKTHVITMRIANIINKGAADPNSILALTFTENAAYNMKQRLTNMIGSEGYKVKISTFHGLCNNLIQNYSEKFQFAKQLLQIDKLTKIQLLQEILDQLIKENKIKNLTSFGNKYHYLNAIIESISRLKKEGFEVQEFKQLLKKHQFNLENNAKYTKQGNLKTNWKKYQNILKKSHELLPIYNLYQKNLQKKGMYDYDDMINFVIKKLRTDPDFLADIQEQYLYTLVDEYQDTNGSQNELIMTINSFDKKPNLFVVGDDDQSIFSFQGANIRNILDFKENFPEAKIISTKYNYRSKQAILDASKNLIEHNQERFDKYFPNIEKDLIAANPQYINANKNESYNQISQKPIKLIKNENNYQELEYTVSLIKKLLKNKTNPNEIAIIYKHHKDAKNLIQRLIQENIKFTTETQNDILSNSKIQKLISFLNAVNNPMTSEKVIEILHLNIWNIEPVQLFKILRYYGKTDKEIELIDILISLKHLKQIGFSKHKQEKILNIGNQILKFWQKAKNYSPDFLYLELLQFSNFLKIAIKNKNFDQINQYNTLLKFIETKLKQDKNYNLKKFCIDIKTINENKLTIPAPNLSKYSDNIRLCTAHSVKGLEFSHVIIYNTVDKKWGNLIIRNLIKLPYLYKIDKKSPIPSKNEKKQSNLEEERRLFFVALTRAKKQIYITYAKKYYDEEKENETKKNKSIFLSEINPKLIQNIDNSNSPVQLEKNLILNNSKKYFDQFSKSFLKGLIANFKLSFTSLTTYQECPRKFLYNFLLKVPKEKHEFMILGSSAHYALENFAYKYKKFQKNNKKSTNIEKIFKKKIFSKNIFIKQALNYLHKQNLEKELFNKISKEISQILENYYEHLFEITKNIADIEKNYFGNIYLDDIALTGKIDLIEYIDKNNNHKKNHVKLIDYKTGKPKSKKALQGDTKAKIYTTYPYKQLIFYKLMTDLDKTFKYQVENTELRFIKPNNSGNFKEVEFEITKDETESMKTEIKENMKKIRNLEFENLCGKKDCDICKFLN